jgi:hypothetical protein
MKNFIELVKVLVCNSSPTMIEPWGMFGKTKKFTYSLCLIAYKLKDLFGNDLLERAYSLFY